MTRCHHCRVVLTGMALALLMPALASTTAAQTRTASANTTAKSVRDVASLATPATATILAIAANGDTIGQGSGFFVSPTGLLVTNWHVLEGATRAIVLANGGLRYGQLAFVAGDSLLDIALLKAPGYDLPHLQLSTATPAVGDPVITIGSPLGLSSTVSTGMVSALRSLRGQSMWQISAPISPGSSGGPVLDDRGRVIAIATGRMRGGEQLGFAVPVRPVAEWLSRAPMERALGSVFATSSPSMANTPTRGGDARDAGGTPSSDEWSPLQLAAPTSTPLPLLSGVWMVELEWHWPQLNMRGRQQGALIADEDNDGVGWVVLSPLRMRPSQPIQADRVYRLSSMRRTAGGGVVLDAAGSVFDGYQTSQGMALAAKGTDRDGDDYTLHLSATALTLRPSANNGIYSISFASLYYSSENQRSGETVQWSGSGAIVDHNDSVYVDMTLKTASGGSTFFTAEGPLDSDGTFSLRASDGSTLMGTLRAGLLTATFRDNRKSGTSFRGALRAERR